jgi:hypothetical protein
MSLAMLTCNIKGNERDRVFNMTDNMPYRLPLWFDIPYSCWNFMSEGVMRYHPLQFVELCSCFAAIYDVNIIQSLPNFI